MKNDLVELDVAADYLEERGLFPYAVHVLRDWRTFGDCIKAFMPKKRSGMKTKRAVIAKPARRRKPR